MKRTPLAMLLVGCLSLAPAGCAVLKPKAAPEREFLLVVDDVSSGAPLPATRLFSPAEQSVRFDIVKGDGIGGTVTINREETQRFGAQWADEEPGVRTEFFRVTEEDGVLLTAAIDYDDNAVTLFNPPLRAMPALLRPGKPHSQEVAVRVVDLRNSQRQRASGSATQTIEHRGTQRVRTPDAEFIAECVAVRFEAKLGVARATQDSTYYLVEGLGIVAIEHEERVTALGLYNRTHRRTLVRRDLLMVESPAVIRR